MITKHKKLIYEYWNKTELGRDMIQSDNISDLDLLFLIPNNKKKMLGLPLTRISGKKKRQQKRKRTRYILTFKLFHLVEEKVERTICSEPMVNEFFNKYADVKSLNIGDKAIF